MNRPAMLVCYICGRQFGTKSLPIHVKACQKKWENEESLKPPKQRRPCPQPPKGFGDIALKGEKGEITKADMNQFNSQSFNTYVEDALVECEYCGRKFNPKSLIPHQKACKTNPMIRKPYVAKGKIQEEPEEDIKPKVSKGYSIPDKISDETNNQQLVSCKKCGRNFAPDRVGKHQKVCKGEEVKAVKGISQKYKLNEPPKKETANTKNKPNLAAQKKAKWQVQHQQFQNAMKQMKKMKEYEAKGGKLSDLPPPPRGNYDHYVQCQYCGRKYAADVAERHIPKCANIINKPGGIKPSTIQQKYIGGTGAGSKPPAVTGNSNLPLKPNLKGKPTPTIAKKY